MLQGDGLFYPPPWVQIWRHELLAGCIVITLQQGGLSLRPIEAILLADHVDVLTACSLYLTLFVIGNLKGGAVGLHVRVTVALVIRDHL